MRPGPSHACFVLIVLLALVIPCGAYVTVPLPNAEITDFTSGVATNWTGVIAGFDVPPQLQFHADNIMFRSAPYSQGIMSIGALQGPGSQFAAAILQRVSTVAGKVYFFVGYQDLYDPSYSAPPARRYAHFFGIDPEGGLTPPLPFAMGNVRWMGVGQWFYNDMPGNSTQIGGMHRCMAACPAQASQITLWSGLFVQGDADVSASPTVFDIDSHKLFQYDNDVQSQLVNAGFETVQNLTPGLDPNDVSRITLPAYWVPIGGGIGQKESYYTDALEKRSGAAGLRIYNSRGCLTRGVMQRVAIPLQSTGCGFSCWVRSNGTAGAVARIGIDPTGGDDINSGSIVWNSYTHTDETWEQVKVVSPCSGTSVTVFLGEYSQAGTTGSVHYADFDDAFFDATPPEPFTVTAGSPVTLVSTLSAAISPAPADPESGIAAVEYAIGTAPGGQEVRAYAACPDPTRVNATGLSLASGQTYYITVRATNGMGVCRTVSSGPILCSPRPYPYTWSQVQHLSQNAYSADNARLAAGQSGKVYAVWRESNDVTCNGSDSRVVLRERTGARWAQPVVVDAVTAAWWPDVAATGSTAAVSYVTPGNSLVNGLHLATRSGSGSFADQSSVSAVSALPRIAYSSSAGFVVGCNRNLLNDPARGVASVVVNGTAESLPGGAYSDSDMHVRVACSGSVVHFLWGRLDSGQPNLYCCSRNASGAYSTPSMVAQGVRSGDIGVSASGEISLVYASGGGVWYARSSDGVIFDQPLYLGAGSWPSISVEPGGRVHVLFFAPAGSTNENNVDLVIPKHMFKDASGWSAHVTVAGASCTSGNAAAQEPGCLIADSNGGLHFAWSHNPHDRGWQTGQFQGYYWIDYRTTTAVGPPPSGIAQAKLWGDDAAAAQLGYPPSKVIDLPLIPVAAVGTFKFAANVDGATVWKSVPYFYAEEPDRSSGIRVIAGDAQASPLPAISVGVGDLVDVSGSVSTVGGERSIGYLTADGLAHGVSYTKAGTGDVIAPVYMAVAALGGAAQGPTPGVTGGVGANNIGLLVRIAGEVIGVSTDERGAKVLYVDDGTDLPCGEYAGCKVYAPGSLAQLGDFVLITGVSSTEVYDPTPEATPGDESYIRVLMPRDSSSISIVGH